eukprot:411435_1
MPVHRRCVFVALALITVLYMYYKYKLGQRTAKDDRESNDEDTKQPAQHAQPHRQFYRPPNVTTKFATKVIPLKPPRNDSYSKALSIHYKFNYSHPQYDDAEEVKEDDRDTLTVITFMYWPHVMH